MVRLFFIIAMTLLFSGCAHKISLEGDINRKDVSLGDKKNTSKVGLYVNQSENTKEFISDGGGGDKLSYYPYKDISKMLYKALKGTFKNIQKVSNNDKNSNIKYFFKIANIETSSSSSSFAFWPPEEFSIKIDLQVFDKSQKMIWGKEVIGHGSAVRSEFLNDFSIAARKASKDAVMKLYDEIISSSIFSNSIQITKQPTNVGINDWR